MNRTELTNELAALSTTLERDLDEREPTGLTIERIGPVINDLRELDGLERRSDLEWVE